MVYVQENAIKDLNARKDNVFPCIKVSDTVHIMYPSQYKFYNRFCTICLNNDKALSCAKNTPTLLWDNDESI